MSKKKTEKMKENRAGSCVPREFAEEIVATIESYEMEPEFAQGAACVLAYLSCPEGSGMHGAEFPSFLDNGIRAAEKRPAADAASAARRVIDALKAGGIEVVDAYVVARGDL